ncbi:hypothetical protein KTAU_40080 [Thermogemmatispora aurantia]|uniref:Uncharacterized protein n=1 Tax=Thermogemmatispora aurantia TaxID=2045279 RepID=A0A5J4KCU3_9CHLR|nr:hypothetical protein KTAU_40080 [Thermogemmatispora aurantia]
MQHWADHGQGLRQIALVLAATAQAQSLLESLQRFKLLEALLFLSFSLPCFLELEQRGFIR